jgi:hypothetical protein
MNLSEAINSAKTLKDQAAIVWQHYVDRKLQNELEPKWTHAGYECVKEYLEGNGNPDNQQLVTEIIHSHSLKDGFSVAAFPAMPSSPMRIIHDGWKSGTPTWIFMGRSEPGATQLLDNGWVAVKRSLPDELYKMMDSSVAPPTLWIAYNLNRQMGTSALTSNCVGPTASLEDLKDAILEETEQSL